MSAFVEPVAKGLPGDSLRDDFDKIVNDCKTLNCNYLRIGMIPLDLMGDKDKTMDFIYKAEAEAKKLAKHGIELYHHTHQDRKSTRLNSSHVAISYAVFCLKKKK